MRLFHVSEEVGIEKFVPRLPNRKDMDITTGLVWAVDEARLPNFLLPRNCPRVTYHAAKNTSTFDKNSFFRHRVLHMSLPLREIGIKP